MSVTSPVDLPQPSSGCWQEWADSLTLSQASAVAEWIEAADYRRHLSPKTVWYKLCGRFIPEERQRRLDGLVDETSPQHKGAGARWARNAAQDGHRDADALQDDPAEGGDQQARLESPNSHNRNYQKEDQP